MLDCLVSCSQTLLENVNAYERTESLVDLYMCAVRGSHYKHIDQCFSNGEPRHPRKSFLVSLGSREESLNAVITIKIIVKNRNFVIFNTLFIST